MSWGETNALAALREEMAQTVQPATWQYQRQPQDQHHALATASYQLPAFQPVAFIMTMVPGTHCQLQPAVMLSAQPQTKLASIGTYIDFQPETLADPDTSKEEHANPSAEGLTRENFDGELPSIGSESHFDGSCKRCAFFPKGRCTNGKDCTHCHFSHEPRSRLRKRCAVRAQRGGSSQEAEDAVMPEPLDGTCQIDALSEVLTYLSEPVAASTLVTAGAASVFVSKKQGVHQRKSEAEVKTPATQAIESFNNALQEIAAAYMTPEMKLRSAEVADDTTDDDTTHSESTLSDGEDSGTMSCSNSEKGILFKLANMSENGASSEASDSEVSPLQGTPSPVSWSSMQRNRKARQNTSLDIARMTRALLNKLTEQRFESLCSQILALELSTPEQLAAVVAEIFQKATTQDGFRKLYTELCMRLDTHLAAQAGAVGGKAFRKALVNECQATFERNLQPPDASLFVNLNADERFELEMKLKTQRLGNMRFIGDLLVKKLLAPKLLPPIVHELLNGSEANLEALVALLAVVTPAFEARPSIYQAPLRDAFAVLGGKMNDKTVCSRVGCQINDLLDAKARGWAPRT